MKKSRNVITLVLAAIFLAASFSLVACKEMTTLPHEDADTDTDTDTDSDTDIGDAYTEADRAQDEAFVLAAVDYSHDADGWETDSGDDDGDDDEDEDEYMTEEMISCYSLLATEAHEKNSDVKCWIVIPGTNISYPVVCGKDNSYYLDRDAEKKKNDTGALYADYREKSTMTSSRNLVIFGHNIRTRGLMFSYLLRYQDEDFFNKYPYVYIYSDGKVCKYLLFSFYQTTVSFNYIRVAFSSDSSFLSFAEKVRDKSMHVRDGVELTVKSELLTLSTCTNGTDKNERFAFHAVKVEEMKISEAAK